MDPKEHQTSAEAELESFRQKWRAEVSARSKGKAPAASGSSANADVLSNKARPSRSNAPDATASTHEPRRSVEDVDQVMPHVYQGLGEKQHGRRLDETSAETAAALARNQEPTSALEHYEKAVEKESEGRLGDSLSLYRKAFKLDDTVDRIYKAKHFPPSYFKAQSKKIRDPSVPTSTAPAPAPKPPNLNPSNASATVPTTAHHSLHGLSATLANLITDFTTLSIQGEPPPTDLSPAPPCPIASVPEEIIVEILEQVAIRDVASFVRLAQVCKRLAYLVTTEDRVWKRLALGHEYGFAAMHYSWTCQVDGSPLGDGDDDEGGIILGTSTPPDFKANPTPPPLALTLLLVPSPYPTYRALFQRRPRIRFNGCYISTVNYTRAGQASPTSVTWNSPIHIVTYYRYIRFLRDGTCISLLSTSEPSDVVPYLYIEHMHKHHGALPSAPIKDALLGRWRLTGPEPRGDDDGDDDAEKEGNVVIEMAGVTPKYMYKMLLGLGTAGRGAKNNKLSWHGYWSYNRLTDDWGEFGLKNDRAFYWSRVRSYGMSWNEKGTKLGKSR